jgi:pantoate--beta-alanine ligase
MEVFEDASEMRGWSRQQRAEGRVVGLVPTMGALHEGHASLIRRSASECAATVVSIFVNPTQFAPHEDYDRYPRTWEADRALCESLGADAVYVPSRDGMYPPDYSTYVEVGDVSDGLESETRPHFFCGVATVVAKLFNAVEPDAAYFGQKDAQQAAVIKRMTRDLDFGINIIVCPIVREEDGLALSSRNKYLDSEQRERALALSRGLFKAQRLAEQGETDAAKLRESIREEMAAVDVDYVAVVDPETLNEVSRIGSRALALVAAKVGETRLIDNAYLRTKDAG